MEILENKFISVEVNYGGYIDKITIKDVKVKDSDRLSTVLLGDNGIIDFNAVEGMHNVTGISKGVTVTKLTEMKPYDVEYNEIVIDKFILPKNAKEISAETFNIFRGAILKVNTVVWPDNCDTIPACAFIDAKVSNLVNIDNVAYIGDSAFENSAISTISWPTNCNYIPSEAFLGSSIHEILNIGHVVHISEKAFMDCKRLKEFDIPAGVTEIPQKCFMNSEISKITGTQHLERIGNAAFSGCKVTSFKWPEKCKVVPHSCFAKAQKLQIITNLESVMSVKRGAFGETNIKELFFSSELTEIGEFAFYCSLLEGIHGIENVESIGVHAFERCALKTFDWPPKCHHIGYCTFLGCIWLKEITGLDNVTQIDDGAFESTSIKSLDLSNSHGIAIHEKAFTNSKLKEVILGYYIDIPQSTFGNSVKVHR